MKFQLSTVLLSLALLCVSLAWFTSEMRYRSEPNYFVKFESLGSAGYKFEDLLCFRGEFVDVNRHADLSNLDLHVTASLLRVDKGYITCINSPSATLMPIPGHPNRMKIECDYPCRFAGESGEFLMELNCQVNGKVVAVAIKVIEIDLPDESLFMDY